MNCGKLSASRLRRMWRSFLLCAALVAGGPSPGLAALSMDQLAQRYADSVDKVVQVPGGAVAVYGQLAEAALRNAGVILSTAQYVVVVDRNPHVQVLLLLRYAPSHEAVLVGASPVSTGKPGEFDHFETPLGVFEHVPGNPDYRALGVPNAKGIRGYGERGLRVFDFGWQTARRTWGDHGPSEMRLQMHATDPELLEPRLGSRQSKGCVRIPAALNRLLDRYGVLDGAYLEERNRGKRLWVLAGQAEVVAEPGRYLIVIQSAYDSRPAWLPTPPAALR